jgi:hypothetical protein
MIFQFTDQRKNHEANIFGQLKQGIEVVDSFDPEIRKFICSYLLRGRREDWGELTVLAVRVFLSNINIFNAFL